MVKRARTSTRRPYARKKARTTMMRRVPRNLSSLRNNVVQFTRTCNVGVWFPGTATTGDFWKYITYSAADITSFGEIASLFDQYRIAAYKVTFRPRFDGFSGNDNTDTTLPGITLNGATQLHIINDPRSTVAPSGTYTRANFNTFLEQGNVRSYMGTRPVSVYVKPQILNTLGGASSFNYMKAPWLQTNASGSAVPHYGFHAFITTNNFSTEFTQAWDIMVKFYIQAKGMR